MALADEALKRGLQVRFSVQTAYTAKILEASGYALADNRDIVAPHVIRDFRGGSSEEEVRRQRLKGSRVMLIDDHGPGRTVANMVTDAFMTTESAQALIHADDVEYLYGLEYAPLRRQFLERRQGQKARSANDGRLCIAFGGSDPTETTQKFISALTKVGFRGPATIIADGSPEGYRSASELTNLWQDTVIYQQVADMAVLMAQADLVATKVGITLLESYCLGKGCVFIEPSPAHVALEAELAGHYASWPALEFGLADEVNFIEVATKTLEILADPQRIFEMGTAAAKLVDGKGTVRLIDALTGVN
jgi:spore coat polysaccharide biosynthesis predicted glycosyltransferase SpsG